MSNKKFIELINNTGVHTNQNGLETYLKDDVLNLMNAAKNIALQNYKNKLMDIYSKVEDGVDAIHIMDTFNHLINE